MEHREKPSEKKPRVPAWLSEIRRSAKNRLYAWKRFYLALVSAAFMEMAFLYACWGTAWFRLDQYMSVICTTTATLTVTMFGLTAASYAFVCSELRTEEQSRPHLKRILTEYRNDLWGQFVYGLVLTAETVATSLICLGVAQKISASDLYVLSRRDDGTLLAAYENSGFRWISGLTALNLLFGLLAIAVMIFHNTMIFRRENQYSMLAKSMLERTVEPYRCPDGLKAQMEAIQQNELEKIHNLERLLNRVLRNHESIGESFAAETRGSHLLEVVLSQKLKQGFLADEVLPENAVVQGGAGIPPEMARSGMSLAKQRTCWYRCHQQACMEYHRITGPAESEAAGALEPVRHGFVQVYEDMLCYRDSKLVLSAGSRSGPSESAGGHMRCSVKKRIMLFLLWGETFSNMDLTGINFSGADLHHTSFSDSDLSRVRLMGANCEGADFSRARMPGLYFYDVVQNNRSPLCQGQIPVSCIDDSKDVWDPYSGREATCFHAATFAGADISRAFLAAQGSPWEASFPYSAREDTIHERLYSLEDACFDHAKLFSSRFRDLSFDRASLETAQIFDSLFFRCSAQSSNFSQAVLTHSLLFCCDFYGANLEGTVLAQSVLARSRFEDARLKNASFAGANLVCCSFRGAYCQNVSFRGVIQDWKRVGALPAVRSPLMEGSAGIKPASGAFEGLDFSSSVLSNTDFTEMDLSGVNFEHAVGSGCIFTGAHGHCVHMDKALLTSSIFNQATFWSSCFNETLLGHSIFMGAAFWNCAFLRTDFSYGLFQPSCGTVFFGGLMRDVSFRGVEGLSAAQFEGVCLCSCDFTGTGLTSWELRQRRNRVISCRF